MDLTRNHDRKVENPNSSEPTSQTVTMVTADGKNSGEVPLEKVEEAIRAGMHLAVEMIHSGTGQRGLIPSHRTGEALKNGFRHVKK